MKVFLQHCLFAMMIFYQEAHAIEIFFVRHGQTDFNKNRIVQGQQNPPLNSHGREQAKEAASFLWKVRFDAVYSSDLARARQTAEIILSQLDQRGLDLKVDRRLREYYFGMHEGKPKTRQFAEDFYAGKNGVEREEQVKKRVWSFFDSLQSQSNNNGKVLIVGHGAVLRLLLKMAAGGKDGFVSNGSILHFRLVDDTLHFLAMLSGTIRPAKPRSPRS